MWSHTHDESNWLTTLSVLGTGRIGPYNPPSIAEVEMAARRYRARAIADMVESAFSGVRRLARKALYRRPQTVKPPGASEVFWLERDRIKSVHIRHDECSFRTLLS